MNPAQHSRLEKEAHPELYCRVPRCLWKIVKRDGTLNPCRNHPIKPEPPKDGPAPAAINVESYVRECLDGVVGDIDLPVRYEHAAFGEHRADGLTAAQRAVYVQIEAALVRRLGPLSSSDKLRLGMALVLEWNRRAAASVSFTATDGRYFANDGDRRAYQRTLDERAARQAVRMAAMAG